MSIKDQLLAELQDIREGFKSIANDKTRSDRDRMIAISELSRLNDTEKFIIKNHK